ncbi:MULTISPECIES: hypothetical protein [Achromobacter]|uniref:Type I restriction endonuclease subunit M n=1 Tax=Achromobacter spanius TaxID=217203 RepID=A0ABY8GSM6_9BURK|nr:MULTISPECIES: hypothetical protein [Achromobacter]WAI83042.1 hypothetical protein N8Z00_26670 [Achromobacter spanius]WEX93127.1 hypothetical protein N3Z32_21265 [Achromobacter sp. SS2-2022]WFP07717.1 hypothetical protein P8T11_25995 [Achromobacter spanius]
MQASHCDTSSAAQRRGLPIPLSEVVATPGALNLLQRANLNPFQMLLRHRSGDWGDVQPEDALANEAAAIHGNPVISSCEVAGERLWVITEADRSATTLLLPKEFEHGLEPKSATHRALLRDPCAMLCLLPKTADPRVDFAEADPELLLALASQLDLKLDCLHQGIAGLGSLLASVPLDHVGNAAAPRQSIASAGSLLADLGQVLLYIRELPIACRSHLADYYP